MTVLALSTDLGMLPLRAHCRLGLGKLYRRIHRAEDARVELSAAIGMLHDMAMALWLRKPSPSWRRRANRTSEKPPCCSARSRRKAFGTPEARRLRRNDTTAVLIGITIGMAKAKHQVRCCYVARGSNDGTVL